ncbi:hypothetical protein [Phaeodactylibacter sp.]|nr:hypothetical protein [Phaeodactylibacter sp.]MCI4650734.1 hypothetical protein [Phaeodactylibacter sp.]MCI5093076.1 hypothetical protein [Phaeodactylibacter sp.]
MLRSNLLCYADILSRPNSFSKPLVVNSSLKAAPPSNDFDHRSLDSAVN